MRYSVEELITQLGRNVESGAWIQGDTLIVEYWSYEDVLDFVAGDDYYGDVTDEIAREVWSKVTSKLNKFDNIDDDTMRDTISEMLDERMKGA